jgi:hypothetical protein
LGQFLKLTPIVMAKPDNGFQLVFNSEDLKSVCEGSKKVVVSCFLVKEVTKDGRKIGAMEVWAEGVGGPKPKKIKADGPSGVPGCPVPPCEPKG